MKFLPRRSGAIPEREAAQNLRGSQGVRLESRPTPWFPLIIGGAMGILVVIGLTAAVVVKVDQVVILPGQLQPLRSTQDVAPPEQSVVTLVLVKEGDMVYKGQPLVILDTRVLEGQQKALIQQGASLQEGHQAELSRLQSALGEQEARERGLQQQLTLTQGQLDRFIPLREQGAYSEVQILEVKKQLASLQSQLEESRKQAGRLRAESMQKQAELSGLQAENQSSLVQNQERLRQIALRAPANGSILNLKAKPGMVARSTEPLLQLVPQDNLEAKAFIRNQDLSFVRPNQAATIAVDAYDRSKYGTIPARVRTVGTDVLPPDETYKYPRFPVTLQLERQYLASTGKRYSLQAGMAITVNLQLEKRSLMELFFSGILNTTDAIRTIR